MADVAKWLLWTCLIGVSAVAPALADEMIRGQVVSVSGGDVLKLVDAHGREYRLRLAFIDAPEAGQPFGDEAQSALSAMVLGRQVTAQLHGKGADGLTLAEVVEPNGHLVNLELVQRGLAWQDYFDMQLKSEQGKYQGAVASAQQNRQGIWTLDRLERPRDYRDRAGQALRWWLSAVAALSSVTLLGLIFSAYDTRISAWIERQDELTKSSAVAYRLSRIQSEAEAEERDKIRDIANLEMDRLAAIRRASGGLCKEKS